MLAEMRGQTAALQQLVKDVNSVRTNGEVLAAVVPAYLGAPRLAAERWLGEQAGKTGQPSKQQ